MTKANSTLVAGGVSLVVLALAFLVTAQFFPTVKDSYFVPDSDQLRRLPAGLVVVRATHFASSKQDGIRHIHQDDEVTRTVGHNVTLRDLLAEAYDWNPARVVLPPDAPNGGFDFLVTNPARTRERLQEAIRKETGLVGHRETRSTDVLVLKVTDPKLTGLTTSTEGEPADIHFQDGRLHFTHQPLSVMLKGLESGLALPVVDQTGLTNFYDFSVVWSSRINEKMQAGTFDLKGVKEILHGWGLGLEEETTRMDTLIAAKAR